MEKVSIVLPCYNHGEFVGDAIKSVLEQSYSNFELFIFDNGSIDDSWEVIRKVDDSRVKKIRFEQNDLLEVKKQFINMASGRYFAIMHSDDIWMREKLEKQMNFFKEHPNARVCFTWSSYVDEQLNPIDEFDEFFAEYNKSEREWWDAFFNRANHLSCPSFVCEREIYIKYFGKLYPYRQIADFYCWMKILEETNLYIVEEILVNQKVHYYGENQNESSRTFENICRETLELEYIVYNIIDKMKDEVFLRYLCSEKEDSSHFSHLDVICKKFLFLLKRCEKYINENGNVIRYYNDHFDDEENGCVFYQYLDEKYGFSRNDFFAYEGKKKKIYTKIQFRLKNWELLENVDFSTIKYPKSVSIYGCGRVGKIFSKKIKPYCKVNQFIDMKPKLEIYDEIPVMTLDKAKIDSESVIVVIPKYDLEDIIMNIKATYPDVTDNNIVSFEDFIKTGKIIDVNF